MRGERDTVLNAALRVPALDAEVSLLAPVRVPRVGDLPVLDAVVGTPADELDGMAADRLAGGVRVDAAGVVLEVGVDGERGLDRRPP